MSLIFSWCTECQKSWVCSHVSVVFVDPPGYFAEYIARRATHENKDPNKYGQEVYHWWEISSRTLLIITIAITILPDRNANHVCWTKMGHFLQHRRLDSQETSSSQRIITGINGFSQSPNFLRHISLALTVNSVPRNIISIGITQWDYLTKTTFF